MYLNRIKKIVNEINYTLVFNTSISHLEQKKTFFAY